MTIDWTASTPPVAVEPKPEPAKPPLPAPALVQRLKWDFRRTFPAPTPEALDAGILDDEDCEPENVRAIHEEHAREVLAALRDLDEALDARRLGLDPKTGKSPTTDAGQQRLRQLESEPARLEQWWTTLMETYEQGFGPEAADAFGKAIRAWHAGIEVTAPDQPLNAQIVESLAPVPAANEVRAEEPASQVDSDLPPQTARLRVVARLPVPTPLPSSVNAGIFGQDERDKPIQPGPHEVREITERHAEKLIDLLGGLRQIDDWLAAPVCSDPARLYHERDALLGRVQSAVASYAEDFGEQAARQLEAYARRQASLGDRSPDPQTRQR